jgi:hypothetical protein
VPSDPTDDTKATAKATYEKSRPSVAYDQQQPGTPSMINAIRRYDFVKRAMEE